MKTLTTLTALILSIASLNVSANDVKKANRTKAAIELPAMNWGATEEVSFGKAISLPEMNWGSPEEVASAPSADKADISPNENAGAARSIRLPEINWGTPEEEKEAVSMKIQLPAMNWGSANEVSGL